MQTSFSKEQFIYAGFFSRLAAFLTDSIVVAFVLLIVKIPIWILQASAGDSFLFQPFLFNFTAVEVFYYLVTLAYFVLMTYYSGATVGKHLMKLKVVDAEGEKLNFMSVLIRESVGKYLSAFIANIGYLMVAFDGRKQGLHDKISDTCVVYKYSLNQPIVQTPMPYGQAAQPMQTAQPMQAAQPMQTTQPMQAAQPMQMTQPVTQPQSKPADQLVPSGPNGRFSLPED